ncbi:MAG: sulfatase [Chloroflexota bacterium]
MSNTKRPNIVLIVLDTHRRDRLGAYGYPRPTSPSIDDFARQATVFDNAVSPSQWTIPAHASMFTGEYPTTHQTLQAHATLDNRFDALAKLLAVNGYQTTGFCNNPLLGILNNGLKRGFDKFYNYCGVIPSIPEDSMRLPPPFNKAWEWYTQQLRKASYPLQDAFAHSDFLFQLSMHPRFVSFWSNVGNFKGHTANSIRDTRRFLEKNRRAPKPQFVFLNLMETHLPFSLPDTFIDKFAPYFKEQRQAREFMRRYNTETFRWLVPLDQPMEELKAAVLNDVYDAEVNYQDHLLGPLLEYLSQAENTLTLIVADHGEGIGEHNFVGHSFVAYQEVVQVPLIVKFPDGAAAGRRLPDTVSTRRIFHTVLAAAGVKVFETNHRPAVDVQQLSLSRTVEGRDPEQGLVFVEAYPPTTFLSMMQKHTPHLIDAFHCRQNRWAVYGDGYKLVRVEEQQDELFDLAVDPGEEQNVIEQYPERAARLSTELKTFVAQALARQPDSWYNRTLNLAEDENVVRQLRALGYIE